MAPWRNTVMASLVSGSSLGSPTISALSNPAALDELAIELSSDRDVVEAGLAARVEQLGADTLPRAEAMALSHEAIDLLAPLADRLGMARWRAELEDASFRLVEPTMHATLALAVGDDLDADQGRIDRLRGEMDDLLGTLGLDGEVTGRVKSLYSTHRKMRRKDVGLDAITDRLALRVKVQTVADCYAMFEAVRANYSVVDAETDDYIASPKANGYRSLHTALLAGDHAEAFELQVRTFDMHTQAEEGAAAHWRYKLQA